MNKVYCNDGCQEEFDLTQLNTNLVEYLPNKIERYYIQCPKCAQQYTSYFLDDSIKKIQQEILMLQKKQSLKTKQKNRLTKLSNRLKFMNNQLIMKYGQGELENDRETTH